MQNNKLRMAIRATAAVTVLGLASQAQAFSFSAGDVDADMYGYVRANFAYDVDEEVADDSASGSFPTIGAGDVAEGHFNASAQQTRVGIKATNSEGVMINVEGDFFGGDFRLRHAYGTYQGILAGQTWSNFNSFVGVTPSVDFSGAAGLAGLQGRATQLRYTTGPMSIALEDPQGSIDRTDEKEGMPALTARLEDSAGSLSYSAAAVVKQNSYDTGTEDDSELGYGVFGAGKVKLTDMISIQGSMTYTDGANSYNFRSGATDAFDDGTGDLDTVSSIGGVLGTSIGLGQGRSINIQHGMVQNDVDDLGATATETNQTTFVNYMWKPADSVTMGAEYQYWKTENEGGDSEDANRVMFMAQYNF
ncbi:MAG: DcaP family trimeric outer membrane transporter [Pseudomonadota bacterium]